MCSNNGNTIFMEVKLPGTLTQFKIWSNEKLVVVSTSKIASRFLDYTFDMGEPELSNEFYIDERMEYIGKPYNLNQQVIDEFNSILSKDNTRDILFLYRNPKKRIITGLSQDFINQFTDNYTSRYLLWFATSKLINNFDIETYISFFKHSNESRQKDMLSDLKFRENIYQLAYAYLDYNLKVNFNLTSHTSNYLYKLHYVVNNHSIDSNKIKLFDIDSSNKKLADFVLKYNDGGMNKEVPIDTNFSLKDIFKSILDEEPAHEKKLDLYLESDIFHFLALKSDNRNI